MKIKYATIIVRDLEESVEYYTKIMGFKESKHYELGRNGRITLMSGENDTMMELIENKKYDLGMYSIGMEVDNVKESLEELRSKNAKMVGEPIKTTDGYCAFIEDPNGVRIALVEHECNE